MLLLCVNGGDPGDQPVAFDDVQLCTERRSVEINHRKRSHLLTDGINDQCFTFVMSNRIALPCGRQPRGMWHIHFHAAHFVVSERQQKHFAIDCTISTPN